MFIEPPKDFTHYKQAGAFGKDGGSSVITFDTWSAIFCDFDRVTQHDSLCLTMRHQYWGQSSERQTPRFLDLLCCLMPNSDGIISMLESWRAESIPCFQVTNQYAL